MTPKDKWEDRHLKDVARYVRQIEAIYQSAVRDIASIGAAIPDFNPDKPFSFADYPNTRERTQKLLKSLKNNIQLVVLNGIDAEWTLANNKNNELCNVVFGKYAKRLTDTQARRYYGTNDNARKAFAERKVAGLDLSDRVWRYTDQFKAEMEMALDLGLRDGLSADEMSRELRGYLKNPDKLFRRVKDEHGVMHLSKQAATYHPGQGVYRSSYKNARRLAATETNIAYRTSDYTRWQQLDFVVGIEIKLSNNHTLNGVPFTDICDELAGKYPKDFKFTGWHPHCRCYAVSILKTPEEMEADNKKIMDGRSLDGQSTNRVKEVPGKFKQWLADNESRITKAKSLPYFMRDNEKYCTQTYITKTAAKGVKEAQAFNDKLSKTSDTATQKVEKKQVQHTEPTTKSAAEIKAEENMKTIEAILDIKKGNEMSFEKANEGRANPNYSKRTYEYTHNCQCCSIAFEMRRRGFDVRATERTLKGISAELAKRSNRTMAYLDPETMQRPKELLAGGSLVTKNGVVKEKSRIILAQESEDLTKETGRYQICLNWKTGGGHRLSAERNANGQLIIYDPQAGKLWKGWDSYLSYYRGMIDIKLGIGILRTDNLLINPMYIAGIVKKN